jgi:hypothetical protein
MIAPLALMFYGTSLTHAGAQGAFNAMDAQAALANSAGPSSNPVALAQMDKALQFQGIQARTNYLVGQAMQENAQRMLKQHEEMRKRLMDAGATLV